MNQIIIDNQEKIFEVCKNHHVQNLYTFGSVNTEKFNIESDIDILISFKMNEINIEEYVDVYFGVQFKLEEILKRKIDLVTERSIKNPYFKDELLKNRKLLYQSN